MSTEKDLDQLSIATIRTLVMDAIEQANSGHPGTPAVTLDDIKLPWQKNSLPRPKSDSPKPHNQRLENT